jgi:hypothetical protein
LACHSLCSSFPITLSFPFPLSFRSEAEESTVAVAVAVAVVAVVVAVAVAVVFAVVVVFALPLPSSLKLHQPQTKGVPHPWHSVIVTWVGMQIPSQSRSCGCSCHCSCSCPFVCHSEAKRRNLLFFLLLSLPLLLPLTEGAEGFSPPKKPPRKRLPLCRRPERSPKGEATRIIAVAFACS